MHSYTHAPSTYHKYSTPFLAQATSVILNSPPALQCFLCLWYTYTWLTLPDFLADFYSDDIYNRNGRPFSTTVKHTFLFHNAVMTCTACITWWIVQAFSLLSSIGGQTSYNQLQEGEGLESRLVSSTIVRLLDNTYCIARACGHTHCGICLCNTL